MKLIISVLLFLSVNSQAQVIINSYRFATAAYDTDAQAFFTALEADAAPVTLSGTHKGCVSSFVVTTKADGNWAIADVGVYPIVGGTAASHSYNLRNPALYKITWVATPTMSSNGVQYNGSTQYGNTGIANNVLSQNDNHISLYSRTNNSAAERDMGVRTGVFWGIELYAGVFYASNCTAAANYVTSGATRTDGLFINTRTASNAIATTRNAADLATGSTASTTPGTTVFYLGCINDAGTATHFTSKQHSFYSLGKSMNSTQMTNWNNAVSTLQTCLGR